MPIDIFILASWIGGIAFALSGFLVGARKDLDVMGIFILAFLTGNGGGIMRDVFIGRVPSAITDFSAIFLVVLAFIAGVCLLRFTNIDVEKRRLFIICDSLGLVAFALTGTLAGIDAGLNIIGVMVLSFLTATGGGIVRDVLVNEVPAVFRSEFYGSVAVLLALIVYGLHEYGHDSDGAIATVFAFALCLRLIAHKMGWHLPRLKF